MKLHVSPLTNSIKNLKELFDLIISLSSDDGDLPRVIEIALLILFLFFYWFSAVISYRYTKCNKNKTNKYKNPAIFQNRSHMFIYLKI